MPHSLEMFTKIGNQRRRQHRDAVLLALRVTDGDLAAHQVEILDSKLQALQEPHAGSVKRANHQPLNSGQPWQLDLEAHAIQKQDCGKRLVVGRCRDPIPHRQTRKKVLHFRRSHLAWMSSVVVAYEAAYPVDAGLLGPQAHVPSPDTRLHLGTQTVPFNHLRISHSRVRPDQCVA